MDATSCFSFLVENIPLWREQISQLTTYTSQKHEDFKAEYTRIVSKVKPRRMKSPSMCSIHTNENENQNEDIDMEQAVKPPNPVDISPFEAGNRYIYAQATKKRKPGTSFRSGASGPMKFRSKQMVVIYYDSYVQDQLDAIVKTIGASRNNLRKGKMSYNVSRGLQLPTLGRKHDLAPSTSGLDAIKSASAYRGAPKSSIVKAHLSDLTDTVPMGEAAFKQTDKDLETCQNLCETAAHQFLRDGDCKLELDTVVQNLDQLLEFVRTAYENLRTEDRRDESFTENVSVTGSAHTESDATLVEKSSREILNSSNKILSSPEGSFDAKRPPINTTNSAPPMMTEIEVDDDSDQSSIEIDLAKFRTMNRSGLRT